MKTKKQETSLQESRAPLAPQSIQIAGKSTSDNCSHFHLRSSSTSSEACAGKPNVINVVNGSLAPPVVM